jgi:SAM-dependent methyltransferase
MNMNESMNENNKNESDDNNNKIILNRKNEELVVNLNNEINKTKNAQTFENENVVNVYNEIAPHFSHTRYAQWPFIKQYLISKNEFAITKNKLLLCADIGCGNGKYLSPLTQTFQTFNNKSIDNNNNNNYNDENNKNLVMFGTDISDGLIKICRNRKLECFVGDNLRIAFRSQLFDVVLSVAVIHHFSTEERRMESIRQLFRICNIGGEILIYAWAFEQYDKKNPGQYKYPEQDVYVPWHLQKQYQKPVKKDGGVPIKDSSNESNLPKNVKIGKNGQLVYHRFYHLFKENELENLVEKACEGKFEFEFVKSKQFEKDNWGVVCKRLK